MKTMKVALLATAALAAVSVSARADDTAAIKAQLEALTARIAQLEAGPAVPVGYSLLTITEGSAPVIPGLVETDGSYGDKATVIGILPTADVPASTSVVWTGFVRAAIAYNDNETGGTGGDDEWDIPSRAEIKVVGKTDTAVGEVGAMVKLRADYDVVTNGNPEFVSPEYWGWWAMTPDWTLGAGYSGSLANVGYGYDGGCYGCYYTDNADVDLNPGDASQMRLSYASGPLGFAIAIEDSSASTGTDDSLGVAAEVKYTGDTFNAELSGGMWDEDDFVIPPDTDGVAWQVGAGVGFSLGDMASLSIGAATGDMWSGDDFWGVSATVTADLSDSITATISAGMKDYDSHDVEAVMAGIYYEPVDQLTIGLEAEWVDDESSATGDEMYVDLVTVFRF